MKTDEIKSEGAGEIPGGAGSQQDSCTERLCEYDDFSFDKGEEISTHAAGGDAMVTVLEGKGRFTVGGEVFYVEEGETLIMPKDIPHAVYGEERFKMQLTVSF